MNEIKKMVDKIIEDGVITAQEQSYFMAAIEEDGKLDALEEQQVVRIINLISDGTLKITE